MKYSCVSLLVGLLGLWLSLGSTHRFPVGRNVSSPNFLSPSPRIFAGNNAEVGEFPWVAQLILGDRYLCGATLINRKHLVTAAHCVSPTSEFEGLVVSLGNHYFSPDPNAVTYEVEQVFVHEEYDPNNRQSMVDLALIRLKEEVTCRATKEDVGAIRPISLQVEPIKEGDNFTVCGFGSVSISNQALESADVLQKFNITKFDDCYEGVNASNYFCHKVLEKLETNIRRGDSGSGLFRLDSEGGPEVVGVVSSIQITNEGDYGIYTKIEPFVEWIQQKALPQE